MIRPLASSSPPTFSRAASAKPAFACTTFDAASHFAMRCLPQARGNQWQSRVYTRTSTKLRNAPSAAVVQSAKKDKQERRPKSRSAKRRKPPRKRRRKRRRKSPERKPPDARRVASRRHARRAAKRHYARRAAKRRHARPSTRAREANPAAANHRVRDKRPRREAPSARRTTQRAWRDGAQREVPGARSVMRRSGDRRCGICDVRRATCDVRHATCDMRHATVRRPVCGA